MKSHVSPIVLLASSTVSAFLTMHDPMAHAASITGPERQMASIVLMNDQVNNTTNSPDESNQTEDDHSSPSPDAGQPKEDGDAKQHRDDGDHDSDNDDDDDDDDDEEDDDD